MQRDENNKSKNKILTAWYIKKLDVLLMSLG